MHLPRERGQVVNPFFGPNHRKEAATVTTADIIHRRRCHVIERAAIEGVTLACRANLSVGDLDAGAWVALAGGIVALLRGFFGTRRAVVAAGPARVPTLVEEQLRQAHRAHSS